MIRCDSIYSDIMRSFHLRTCNWEMTEFDLTEKDTQIITLCLLYCSGLLGLGEGSKVDISKFVRQCKEKKITVDDMIELDNRIRTQRDER